LHCSLAWTMLHNAIIGATSVEHPYFQAFLEGLKLPCKGIYDLTEITQSFCGGTSEFVVNVLNTNITSFSQLRLKFSENISESNQQALTEAFARTGSHSSFNTLFQEFLEGVGAPSLPLLDSVKGRFHALISDSLDNLNQPFYRMKMFCWVTSGAPRILLDETEIRVSSHMLYLR
ncbi:hypothetical protein BDP27DRAFT_1208918, partial [Rhodocollybia butyracea]